MLLCAATLALSSVLGANSVSCQLDVMDDDDSAASSFLQAGVQAAKNTQMKAAAEVGFIIGTGLPKTATTSLREALELLGRKTAHGATMYMDLLNPAWEAFDHGDSGPALEKLFKEGYNATAGDSPWCYVYEDLMRLVPNYKVIMSIHPRGPDAWVDSTDTWNSHHIGGYLPGGIKVTDIPPEKMNEDLYASQLDCFINETRNHTWRERCKQGYLAHYDNVRRVVPPDRLLEFNVSDGWAPLCNFLNLPVPEVPFPDVNDRSNNHTEKW